MYVRRTESCVYVCENFSEFRVELIVEKTAFYNTAPCSREEFLAEVIIRDSSRS